MSFSRHYYEPSPSTHSGLWVMEYPVHGDSRGCFASPIVMDDDTPTDLRVKIVQTNFSISCYGTTRGVHAEPWDKQITVIKGEVLAAIVNMRDPEHFGSVCTIRIKPGICIHVPNGFGNSFQVLSEEAIYSYAVTDVWKPGIIYPAINPYDEDLAIPWIVPVEKVILSDKDLHNPLLKQALQQRLNQDQTHIIQ